MSVVSKLLRALRASPLSLTFALGELFLCGLWLCTVGSDGGPIDPDMESISETEAEALLVRDLESSEGWVRRLIKTALTKNQYSALTSFTFNVGAGALQRSTLRMKLNRGEYQGAADEFPKWRMAGGRILAGLVRCRAVERALFLAK